MFDCSWCDEFPSCYEHKRIAHNMIKFHVTNMPHKYKNSWGYEAMSVPRKFMICHIDRGCFMSIAHYDQCSYYNRDFLKDELMLHSIMYRVIFFNYPPPWICCWPVSTWIKKNVKSPRLAPPSFHIFVTISFNWFLICLTKKRRFYKTPSSFGINIPIVPIGFKRRICILLQQNIKTCNHISLSSLPFRRVLSAIVCIVMQILNKCIRQVKTWCRGHDSNEGGQIGLEYEVGGRCCGKSTFYGVCSLL